MIHLSERAGATRKGTSESQARSSEYVLESLPYAAEEIQDGLRSDIADDEWTDEDQEHHANYHQEIFQYHFFDIGAEKLAHHIERIHREFDPVDGGRQERRVIGLGSRIAHPLALRLVSGENPNVNSNLDRLRVTLMSYRQPERVIVFKDEVYHLAAAASAVFVLEVALIILLIQMHDLLRGAAVQNQQVQVDFEVADEVVAFEDVPVVDLQL